jgi:hypothetical protein
VEVSTGKGTHAGAGALIGFASAALALTVYTLKNGLGSDAPTEVSAVGLLVVGAGGGLVGAFIGAAIPREKWRMSRIEVALNTPMGATPELRLGVRIYR